MPDASSLLTSALPADDAAAAAGVDWNQVLFDAFDESVPEAGFLPLAEDAVRAQPADPTTLLAAATAALFDGKTARAQVFLKRFFKRYQPTLPYQLLRALVAASENKPAAARAILEAHGMAHAMLGMRQFFGGWARQEWLVEHYDRIFERRKRAAAPGARRRLPRRTRQEPRRRWLPLRPGPTRRRHPPLRRHPCRRACHGPTSIFRSPRHSTSDRSLI
jgi:hypothetical protein